MFWLMRVLIVDDDRKIRDLLQKYLESEGLQAESAENAEIAYKKITAEKFDALIVDVMMPGENGMSFTTSLKNEMDIPILMLTAKGEVEDRIMGLESGADDYLQKPFEPKELYLRVVKLAERAAKAIEKQPKQESKIVKFGDFEFNLENLILTKNAERISTSSSELELLKLFCSNINVSIERAELAKKFNGISERSVDVQITRLRKKIETDPKNPLFLQTSRGKGYVFRV
jgi:two-component system phosphate regulon response regulator OmpR